MAGGGPTNLIAHKMIILPNVCIPYFVVSIAVTMVSLSGGRERKKVVRLKKDETLLDKLIISHYKKH